MTRPTLSMFCVKAAPRWQISRHGWTEYSPMMAPTASACFSRPCTKRRVLRPTVYSSSTGPCVGNHGGLGRTWMKREISSMSASHVLDIISPSCIRTHCEEARKTPDSRGAVATYLRADTFQYSTHAPHNPCDGPEKTTRWRALSF